MQTLKENEIKLFSVIDLKLHETSQSFPTLRLSLKEDSFQMD